MIQSDFPALSNKRYFNYGGQGTLPQCAIDAIAGAYKYVQEVGPFSNAIFHWMYDEIGATRRALNEELGGEPDCWAITASVTEGCNIVMWGLDWHEGDRILLTDSEHNGVVGAAENLAKRHKLSLDYFAVAEKTEAEILDALRAAMTPRTKLVVFSHVLWNTGQVLPIEAMVDIVERFGAQALVDGAQSAGVIAMDLSKTDIDYYAITGHKWLCGPEGVGALYIRQDRLTQLHPTFVGWRTDMTAHGGRVDGSRFEVATTALPLLAGFRSALTFHRDKGGTPEEREQLIRQRSERLRRKLSAIAPNPRLITHADEGSGLTSFAVEGKKHSSIVHDLEAKHYLLRTIPTPDAIRASTHYFTSEADVDALVDAIADLLS
jgi:L-cysteine/cystine lyase